MELAKSLRDFAISALPVAILYFCGWAYLSFYLSAFGINIGELGLDIQTVFVYSFSPIYVLATQQTSVVIIALGLYTALYIIYRATRRRNKATSEERQFSLSFYDILSYFLFGLVVFLALLIPIRWGADYKSQHLWSHGGTFTDAAPALAKSTPDLTWSESYASCRERRELSLIFSSGDRFYLLCRDSGNQTQGLVFELKGPSDLRSVRIAAKAASP
jgi:uncharacterized membrane protein YidH (DUF202 family)